MLLNKFPDNFTELFCDHWLQAVFPNWIFFLLSIPPDVSSSLGCAHNSHTADCQLRWASPSDLTPLNMGEIELH